MHFRSHRSFKKRSKSNSPTRSQSKRNKNKNRKKFEQKSPNKSIKKQFKKIQIDKHPIQFKRKPIIFKKHSNVMDHDNNKNNNPDIVHSQQLQQQQQQKSPPIQPQQPQQQSLPQQQSIVKSVNSNESNSPSLGSIGMGCSNVKSQSALSKQYRKDLALLLPEGSHRSTESVYDCIVYLIYCPEHDRIAVTNVDKLNCVWLPFVVLPEGITWKKASHEGVAALIGRQDPELEADEAEKTAPIYTMSYLHILRIQMPSSNMIMRLTQFVHLSNNPFFKCCENTMRVNWIPSGDIVNDKVEKLWGPEVKMLTAMLLSNQPQIIDEFHLSNTLYYLNTKDTPEHLAIIDRGLNENKIYAVYSDYVEHCYPSFYMCFESFRSYMIKRGFEQDQNKILQLFHSFQPNIRQKFIGFHEFLIGIIVIDPDTKHHLEARLRAIFRFYDKNKSGYLTFNDLYLMMQEVHYSENNEHIKSFINEALQGLDPNHITYANFSNLKSNFIAKLDKLYRIKNSILAQIIKKKKSRSKSKGINNGFLKAKRNTKGTCLACRAQQYRYGTHSVTLDTVGRCVEPKIIFKELLKDSEDIELTRRQYSMEFIYSISSIPNIFIDLVRDFYLRTTTDPNPQHLGLMATLEDRSIFTKYLRILCTELKDLLNQEDKLIKTNVPAIVIGDIQGDLHSLMQMKTLFFQTFPVMSENLIFLGNYSGCNSFGIECLVFLFSLKLLSPNKVFLLRGNNELLHQTNSLLKKELLRKYGQTDGMTVLKSIQEIFALLPIVVILDEQIACLHSGVPMKKNLKKLYKLPKEMMDLEHSSKIANEIITRYPSLDSKKLQCSPNPKPENMIKSKSSSNSRRKKNNSHRSQRQTKFQKSSGKSLRKSSSIIKKSVKNLMFKSIKFSPIGKSKITISKSNKGKNASSKMKINFKTLKDRKFKMSFLKNSRVNRKSIKFKPQKCEEQPIKSPLKSHSGKKVKSKSPSSSKTSLSPSNTGKSKSINTFNQKEFEQFLNENQLSYLIRSQTHCSNGYRMDFDNKCLTVFSCTGNPKNLNNSKQQQNQTRTQSSDKNSQAAVVVIDGSNNNIRIVRF